MDEKLGYKPTEEEQKIFAECMSDCFWFRSLPAACVAGIGVLAAIKSGRLAPSKYGIWPKVLGSSGLAYILAKESYLLGEKCDDKFLQKSPNSEMAERIRYNRSNTERKIWMECMKEAILLRALPALTVSSIGLSYATRGSKLKWPVTIVGGSLSFIFAINFYLNVEQKCKGRFDKYLKQAPNSDFALMVNGLKENRSKREQDKSSKNKED